MINVDEAIASIPDIKERARIACVSNPALWIAVQGVSLNDYI